MGCLVLPSPSLKGKLFFNQLLFFFNYKYISQNSKHFLRLIQVKQKTKQNNEVISQNIFLKNRIVGINMISITVSLFTVTMVKKKNNEQNKTSILPKQLHQCWDFAHNSWTNRGISSVFSLLSFPQRAQYEVQHNTNISLLTFQSWEKQGVVFFFVFLFSLRFVFSCHHLNPNVENTLSPTHY